MRQEDYEAAADHLERARTLDRQLQLFTPEDLAAGDVLDLRERETE